MAKPKQQIYSDLPPELFDADDVMQLYGQWAMDRGEKRRCGSAEGNYRAGGEGAREARREPVVRKLSTDDALRCQRALATVADAERVVLTILYVPQRLPAEAQLRLLRIPPQLSRVRHLAGLRTFWNWYRLLSGTVPSAVTR
ncbi:MAG: hypothetical protein EKK53_15290 [Burkholderiales bacterium]|nr:MAG: hypothetical protein EKK53_15290 [Burkholderiales bacterium]